MEKGTKQLGRALEMLCVVCMAAGAVVVATLPWSLRWYLARYHASLSGRVYTSMLTLLAISGVSAFIILGYGRGILHDISLGDPFTLRTARRFRAVAAWCLPIAGAYLGGVFFLPSAFVVMVGLAFAFLAVLLFLLAELFAQAARYKQENDLTI